MPKVEHMRFVCRCGQEHLVRLAKVAEGGAFECLACGHTVEGEALRPLPPKPSRKLVSF